MPADHTDASVQVSHVENSLVSDARRPSVRFVAETMHWPVFVGSASYVVQNAFASTSVVNSLHAEVVQFSLDDGGGDGDDDGGGDGEDDGGGEGGGTEGGGDGHD